MSSTESSSCSTGSEGCSDEAEVNYLSRWFLRRVRMRTTISSRQQAVQVSERLTWCTCANCQAMDTDDESICCQEVVSVDLFNVEKCILNHEDFIAICMNSAVLKMTLTAINHLQPSTLPDNNKSLRYAGYHCYTWWIHSRLEEVGGKQFRNVRSGQFGISIRTQVTTMYHLKINEQLSVLPSNNLLSQCLNSMFSSMLLVICEKPYRHLTHARYVQSRTHHEYTIFQ